MYEDLLARHLKDGYNCDGSQTNIHRMLPYSNTYKLCYNNGSREYNVCHLHTDLDFLLYHSLMSIAYSDCDKSKLEYDAYQHKNRFSMLASLQSVSP